MTGKTRNVVDLEARTFERVIVATSSETTEHVYELEPADETGRIAWGPFFVEGRFRVASEITNTRDASAAWHGFGSILPSVVLEAIDSWVRNEPESRNERDAWQLFEARNAELLRPLAKALRSRARTEFLDRVRGQ